MKPLHPAGLAAYFSGHVLSEEADREGAAGEASGAGAVVKSCGLIMVATPDATTDYKLHLLCVELWCSVRWQVRTQMQVKKLD